MVEHKTVFISYRRTNIYIARAVYQDLRANGFDVFLDYQSIDSGDFTRVILNQIAARAHFVLLLTPSALERCVNSDDMLRMEIEHAVDLKRNFVPLIFEGFDFKFVEPYLASEKLKRLSKYNGLRVHDDYFEEAMTRLRTRFLNLPLEGVLHPIPQADQIVIQESIAKAEAAPEPKPEQIRAEECFERGFTKSQQGDYKAAIQDYTETIRLNRQFTEAYYWRGDACLNLGEDDIAVQNYQKAIDLAPNDRRVNIYQSMIYRIQEQHDKALSEAEKGIALNPEYYEAYAIRGGTYAKMGKLDAALADLTESIRLNPQYAVAYSNRGKIHQKLGNHDAALADYDEAIRLRPRWSITHNNRGWVKYKKGDTQGAIADFESALQIDPNNESAKKNLNKVLREQKGFWRRIFG